MSLGNGYPDPENPSRYLDLCSPVDRGEINELWIVASQDVPDSNLAEVLEHKLNYDAAGNRVAGYSRCAGNGCFDADVPFCGRSLKIGFVNYTRGSGCYLHSIGHGIEWMSRYASVPALSEWFKPFAGFDLNHRCNAPVSNFYDLSCTTPPCLSFGSPTELTVNHRGSSRTLSPYSAECGNVHFPPNAVEHYDYDSTRLASSTCRDFGRTDGGTPTARNISASDWSSNSRFTTDCGGPFLIWWYQNMPASQSEQHYSDGRSMPSIWPFFYY